MRESIKNELFRLKDEKYKVFSLKLLPGVPQETLIGVRIPLLRKIAGKAAVTPGWKEFLKENDNLLFEEKMIQGMIIGKIKADPLKKIKMIEGFLPKIDNWSLCDSFCTSLKFAGEERNQKQVWEFIENLFSHKEEYYVRFAAVMALTYFLNKGYLENVLIKYNLVNHQGYYAKMAVAWGISMAYVKNPEKTRVFLLQNNLDSFTYSKSLQKIRESFQISEEEKEFLKGINKGTRD